MHKQIKIAPSILSADFANLASEIDRVEKAGCDLIHLDVMDGHFVPNLTIGPAVVASVRQTTKLPLDAHLMIDNPEKYAADFARAGANHITIHAEACPNRLDEAIRFIRTLGVTCGVSLKPSSPLSLIDNHLSDIDMVLLMTVNPGFGGQSFMREVLPKIEALRKKYTKDIEVDGGINKETAVEAVRAGANVLVAGTAIFSRKDTRQAIEELRCARI